MSAALAFLVLGLVVLGFLGSLALAVALGTLLVAASLQLDLLRTHKKTLGETAKTLAEEVRDQQAAEKHVESLRAEIRNLARSEIGHLFKTTAGGAGQAAEGPARPKGDDRGPRWDRPSWSSPGRSARGLW